jgi:hypothetical protein
VIIHRVVPDVISLPRHWVRRGHPGGSGIVIALDSAKASLRARIKPGMTKGPVFMMYSTL